MNHERLKCLLRYEPETGFFYWRAGRGKVKAGDKAGAVKASGYVEVSIDYKSFLAHRLAWLYVHGALPPGEIDHVNRNRSDNRIENLRCVTASENQQNKGLQRNNSSGLKGVSWYARGECWQAFIAVDGRNKRLGSFPTKEEAFEAYCAAASRVHRINPAGSL
ncbi:HNH endonuclease [Roseateles puraquae]|uniref:HNH endonuclease n=1 Tax=Roseateles puraquae TaxID=431059 RepID=UPI0031D076E2